MITIRRMIRILAVYLCVGRGCCQEGYFNQEHLRLQQNSDGQVEAITGYSANFQREPNSRLTSGSAHYLNDDVYNTGEYSRAGRSRKVYRIKNPFQHQEEERSLHDTNTSQDSGTAASNQYAALQYSLPPEEFLQQMRAESQYQQQQQQQQLQQQQQQFSTQVPASPYTATPQPQYQYSTLPASNYDMNQQNQISTVEPKSFTPGYQSNTNAYQYSNQNSYNTENVHSTPLPPYMSTSSNQYLGTPANNYVSSSSSLYVSSPQSSQQYVSSPFSNIHSANYDYNNNRVTTVSNSLSYDSNNDVGKRMQIDHYDNAANGIRYPGMHGQYQNDFPSTTATPTSTPYTETPRDFWQSSVNSDYSALSRPEQSYQTQYQNFRYNQQEGRYDTDASNSDNHRIGTSPSANNLYLNFAQPDYQFLSNLKDPAKDAKTELGQQEVYSHGDYGWKLSDKKSSLEPEISTNNNFFKYQIHSVQPDTGAVSQMSFQMDSRKPYNFEQNTKPVVEKLEAEEFTKAAAKAHENYKQQQLQAEEFTKAAAKAHENYKQQQLEANKYLANTNYNSNLLSNSYAFNSYHNNEKQRNKLFNDHSNSQEHTQSELVTASPFFYMNSKETVDSSHKQPFDHDKALKNIVPIDVSNVVQNSDSQAKFEINLNNRYSFPGFNKEHAEQNVKQYSRPDSYYNKDRDTINAFNLKSKLDDSLDKLKQFEQSLPYYAKHQTSDSIYNYGSSSGNKRFVSDSNSANQLSNHQDQTSANIYQQQRPQLSSDILKFNDIPYRLTPSLQNFNFGQSSIPTPLPLRINQNVDNHNVDITAEILAKLLSNKQNMNRPDSDSQSNNLLSTINGFRVANPFNVDLKLVADMLKGKPAIDDSQMTSLRGDINKPLSLDISQLQQLMQLKNDNNILASNAGLGSYLDIYSSGRLPYQGVKYSRSEEDTENIPITDSSSNHPIGAVVEEDAVNGQDISDLTDNSEDTISTNIDDEIPKSIFSSSHKTLPDRHRHLSSLYLSRYSHKRKYPKSEVNEPYPLLKPPPPHSLRYRTLKNSHRRRVTKPKMLRVYKAEPLFESEDIPNLRRSLIVAEEKSETVNEEETT